MDLAIKCGALATPHAALREQVPSHRIGARHVCRRLAARRRSRIGAGCCRPTTNTLPNASNKSRTLATATGLPAAIIANAPFCAPAAPPLTGASTVSIPRVNSPAAAFCSVREPMVDKSTRIFTAVPSITPSAPRATALRIAGLSKLVKTTCALSATSRTLFATLVPSAESSSRAF